jgi:hypothetical protein
MAEWLRGELREMTHDLLFGNRPAYADYISQGALAKAWRAHQSGRRAYAPLFWAMLMFELWAKRFLSNTELTPCGQPCLVKAGESQ